MVLVILRAGLGNQMFQYALGKALAIKYNTDLVLDTTYLNDRFPRKEFTFRTYDLDIFAVKPKFTALSGISSAAPIPGFWLALDLGFVKAQDAIGFRKLIKEKKDYVFDPSALEVGESVALWGYWQSPKYFEAVAKEVREDFRFQAPLTGRAAEIAAMLREKNSIAMHVRRGDYAKFQSVKAMMGGTTPEYYKSAAKYLSERVKEPHFFLFSDDIAWCEEHIKVPFPTTYVQNDAAGPKAAFHLQLMSLAKHNVIANSTFSWWGAWLNANPGKIVVAPREWVRGVPTTQLDIVPAGWITL